MIEVTLRLSNEKVGDGLALGGLGKLSFSSGSGPPTVWLSISREACFADEFCFWELLFFQEPCVSGEVLIFASGDCKPIFWASFESACPELPIAFFQDLNRRVLYAIKFQEPSILDGLLLLLFLEEPAQVLGFAHGEDAEAGVLHLDVH